jgi:hypothetical protein
VHQPNADFLSGVALRLAVSTAAGRRSRWGTLWFFFL